jgi:predicted kinase
MEEEFLDRLIRSHKSGWQEKHWIAYNLLVDSGKQVYEELPKLDKSDRIPNLIVCTGYPGAGKTEFGKKLEAQHGYKMIDSDIVRDKMFPDGTETPTQEAKVTMSIIELRDHYLTNGYDTILTAGSSTNIYRKTFLDTNAPTANRMLLYMVAEREVIKQRRGQRTFEFMDLLWEEPDPAAPYLDGVKFVEVSSNNQDEMEDDVRIVLAELER